MRDKQMNFFYLILIIIYKFFFVQSNKNNVIKPHIIVIIGDDLGWNDFGLHGSNQIPTPNLDALAYNGVILNRFYTQQSCSPSRAALLTGYYPIHLGMQGFPLKAGENRSLPLDKGKTMAELLKLLGYRTHLVGKWHLGAAHKIDTPLGKGFDSHYGYWNGFMGYFDYIAEQEIPTMNGYDMHDNLEPDWSTQGTYATELFTKRALDILDEYLVTNQSIFLVVSHLAGHTGRFGSELGVPNINETNKKFFYIKEKGRRRLAEIVSNLDYSTGQIVEKLQKNNMLENSIILFFSDNGAPTKGVYKNYGSNWPFRGIKMSLLEGGVRGTGFIYSPLFKKNNYINMQLIHLIDFLPTFYYAAGGNMKNLHPIDGINQWQTISENRPTKRQEVLLNIDEINNYSGIITHKGRFKLLNGSYSVGIFDQYYGESGRGPNEPPYDIQKILKSPTNIAIEQIKRKKQLNESMINRIRNQLNYQTEFCRQNITDLPTINCTNFCLFDLIKDPCELENLTIQNRKLTELLKKKLKLYWNNLIPQTNQPADYCANPKFFNNTWTTWLDLTI